MKYVYGVNNVDKQETLHRVRCMHKNIFILKLYLSA